MTLRSRLEKLQRIAVPQVPADTDALKRLTQRLARLADRISPHERRDTLDPEASARLRAILVDHGIDTDAPAWARIGVGP